MGWYDDFIGQFTVNEGDDHVWRDDENTVCVRLYNEGLTAKQEEILESWLEQGDNYNVYVGDNDYPDYVRAYEPAGYAGDLRDLVPPYQVPPDVIPKMPLTVFGFPAKVAYLGGITLMLLFGSQIRRALKF